MKLSRKRPMNSASSSESTIVRNDSLLGVRTECRAQTVVSRYAVGVRGCEERIYNPKNLRLGLFADLTTSKANICDGSLFLRMTWSQRHRTAAIPD